MLILRNKKTGSVEGELEAIHRIVTSLEPLNPHARRRVLHYALEFLAMEKPRRKPATPEAEIAPGEERGSELSESPIFTQ